MRKAADQDTPPEPPLVLDVDGTLLRTDLLYETFWAALGAHPAAALHSLARYWRAPARLKHALLSIARPDVALLPVRDQILDRAREAQAAGRSVHLASGAAGSLVDDLAAHLQFAGPNYGSTPQRNLIRDEKAAEVIARFGAGQYDYAGNAPADLPIWAQARKVIAVAPGRRVENRLRDMGKPCDIIEDGWVLRDLIGEMRPMQWLKNLLLFLPLLLAHHFQWDAALAVLAAAMAFSLAASAIYIFNDLSDLAADRAHPEKCNRPIAAGRLPIPVAMAACCLLTLVSWGLALMVSPAVWAMTAGYMVLNLGYSLVLKKRRWLDVAALAAFFLIRFLTGASAAQVQMPIWMAGVILTFFLSLACVKRLTALSRLRDRPHLPGRSYGPDDLIRLERLAYGAALGALCFFVLGVFSPHSAQLYSNTVVLSFAALPMAVWLTRVIRLSVAGRESYDPLRFVVHDLIGLALLALAGLLVVLAV